MQGVHKKEIIRRGGLGNALLFIFNERVFKFI